MRLSDLHSKVDIYNKRLYNEDMDKMPTIYLDMDGVLADFFGGVEKLYGVDHWKELTNDKTKDLKSEVIARITGTNFFETLPKFPTADNLVKMIKDFTGGTYSINTSPLRGDNENSAKYKKVWINKHLEQPKEIVVTGRKESWAINKQTKQPNILIDDRPVNIQRWTQAGGFGILYQANRDSLSKVQQGLQAYKSKHMVSKTDEYGVGIVTKQNATKDVPVGGQYMNLKKLKLGKGKPKAYFENVDWQDLRDKGVVMPYAYQVPGKPAPSPTEPNIITAWNLEKEKPDGKATPYTNTQVTPKFWQAYMDRAWPGMHPIKKDQIRKSAKLKMVPFNENFADGKGPGKPGDSQRHGIPKGATMAQLQKAAKAPGRKGQLARWQINMRKGRKNKK